MATPPTRGTILFLELYKRDGFFSDLEMMLCAGELQQRGYSVRRIKWWLDQTGKIDGLPHPFSDDPNYAVPENEVAEAKTRLQSGDTPSLIVTNRLLVTNLGTWLAEVLLDVPLCLAEFNRDLAYPDIRFLMQEANPVMLAALTDRLRDGRIPTNGPSEVVSSSLLGGIDTSFKGYWDRYHPLLEYEQIGAGDTVQDQRAILLMEGGCPFRADVRSNDFFDDVEMDLTEEEHRGCSFCYEAGDPGMVSGRELLRLFRQQIATLEGRTPPPEEYSADGLRILAFMPEIAQAILDVRPHGKRFLFPPRVDTITQNRDGIEEALRLLDGSGYKIVFHLIGFENFSQRELDRYNKGVAVQQNLGAMRLMRQWEADFPDVFESTGYSSHGFLMFNPWTTPEDLAINAQVIIDEKFEEFRERPWLTKLRLTPHLPLYSRARRDGLLIDSYGDARVLDTSHAHGYMQENPWRFQDPRTDRIYRMTQRLLGRDVLPSDQRWLKARGWSEAETFQHIVEVFLDGGALGMSDEEVLGVQEGASNVASGRRLRLIEIFPNHRADSLPQSWLLQQTLAATGHHAEVLHWYVGAQDDEGDQKRLRELRDTPVQPDKELFLSFGTRAPRDIEGTVVTEPKNVWSHLDFLSDIPPSFPATSCSHSSIGALTTRPEDPALAWIELLPPRPDWSEAQRLDWLRWQLKTLASWDQPRWGYRLPPGLWRDRDGNVGAAWLRLVIAAATEQLLPVSHVALRVSFDEAVSHLDLWGEATAMLEGTDLCLALDGIDFRTFSEAGLEQLGWPHGTRSNLLTGVSALMQLERNFPQSFSCQTPNNTFGLVTPWSTVTDIRENMAAFRSHAFTGLCQGPWLERADLWQASPATQQQAIDEGLIHPAEPDGRAWQFHGRADPAVAVIQAWAKALLQPKQPAWNTLRSRLMESDIDLLELLCKVLGDGVSHQLPAPAIQKLLLRAATLGVKL